MRRYGFDIESGAVTDRFAHHDPTTAKGFVVVPHYGADGSVTWQHRELEYIGDVTKDGKVVERYRGSAGAELIVHDRTKRLGVAFGLETAGGTLWMQHPGSNTPIEEGGDGVPLDGTL